MTTTTEPGSTCNFDQFMARVAETFPAYRNGEWSSLERGIFNGLLANVVQRLGTGAVTTEVLERVRDDMKDVARQYRVWQSSQ
jgi:uncharacterized protein (DUF2267 family)